MTTEGAVLARLVGEKLSSVTFVMDYLQLDFDGEQLTCFVWPVVSDADGDVSFEQAGYRDRLCALIAKNVVVAAVDDAHLRVAFTSGESLDVALGEEHRTGPEAAMYRSSTTGEWMVW